MRYSAQCYVDGNVFDKDDIFSLYPLVDLT